MKQTSKSKKTLFMFKFLMRQALDIDVDDLIISHHSCDFCTPHMLDICRWQHTDLQTITLKLNQCMKHKFLAISLPHYYPAISEEYPLNSLFMFLEGYFKLMTHKEILGINQDKFTNFVSRTSNHDLQISSLPESAQLKIIKTAFGCNQRIISKWWFFPQKIQDIISETIKNTPSFTLNEKLELILQKLGLYEQMNIEFDLAENVF